MPSCSGIKADGGRCKGQAIGNSQWCFSHHPDYAEARKQRASRGGKRGGRGRPQAELADLKTRLSNLADDVLGGRVDRGAAGVVSQVLNVYLRAVSIEMRLREVEDLERRLEELEASLERQNRSKQWGA